MPSGLALEELRVLDELLHVVVRMEDERDRLVRARNPEVELEERAAAALVADELGELPVDARVAGPGQREAVGLLGDVGLGEERLDQRLAAALFAGVERVDRAGERRARGAGVARQTGGEAEDETEEPAVHDSFSAIDFAWRKSSR